MRWPPVIKNINTVNWCTITFSNIPLIDFSNISFIDLVRHWLAYIFLIHFLHFAHWQYFYHFSKSGNANVFIEKLTKYLSASHSMCATISRLECISWYCHNLLPISFYIFQNFIYVTIYLYSPACTSILIVYGHKQVIELLTRATECC